MAGWEELSPDQIMQIFWMMFIAVNIYAFGRLAVVIVEGRTMKRLEIEIKQLTNNPNGKPSLFKSILNWWKKRKEKKKQDELLKPTGVFN